MTEEAKQYIIDRLKEASTWRGIVAIITAFGVALNPEQTQAIVAGGMGVAGFIGIVCKDSKPK